MSTLLISTIAVAALAAILLALVARCGDADLLVVGAGRSESERGRRGVGAACFEAASCPVTVVPGPHVEPVGELQTLVPTGHQRHGRARARKAGTAAKA